MGSEPLVGLGKTLLQPNFWPPTNTRKLVSIEELAWRSIWFGVIGDDLSFEPHDASDELREDREW